jgi:hypothetical protein
MASIPAGRHTFGDLFRSAGFDFEAKAAADYNNGAPDYRRVKVGGIGFDSLDDVIVVPYTVDTVAITLDGEDDTVLDVTLSEEDKEFRRRSFESAADANDPNA